MFKPELKRYVKEAFQERKKGINRSGDPDAAMASLQNMTTKDLKSFAKHLGVEPTKEACMLAIRKDAEEIQRLRNMKIAYVGSLVPVLIHFFGMTGHSSGGSTSTAVKVFGANYELNFIAQ